MNSMSSAIIMNLSVIDENNKIVTKSFLLSENKGNGLFYVQPFKDQSAQTFHFDLEWMAKHTGYADHMSQAHIEKYFGVSETDALELLLKRVQDQLREKIQVVDLLKKYCTMVLSQIKIVNTPPLQVPAHIITDDFIEKLRYHGLESHAAEFERIKKESK